ncbi:MAG: outer membrane protein assembly factor BamB family protein [Pirellulaceae bacterium]
MNIPIRYPALAGTAVVAATFSLIVGLLITADFVGRGKFELFDAPEYLLLKQQLKDQPGNEQVQQSIRELDLHLRDSYFRNRQFLAQGLYLLLGGVALTLVAARWAISLRRQLYLPPPVNPEIDSESVNQRYGLWAAVCVIAMVVAVLCGITMRSRQILPEPADQVASLPSVAVVRPADAEGTASPPPADPAPGPQPEPQPKPKPDVAAQPDAALPPYDTYLQQWPRFRGPLGSGVSQYSDIPQQWSVPDNVGIAWKAAVPLPGNNSPVVWDKRVLLSGATAEEQAVFCFDAASGSLQWRHDLPPTKPAKGELEVSESTGYAAPTMATDGLRAYAIFATGDVVALSLEGQELWHKNLGIPKNPYGHASSLATYNDLLIVQLDQGLDEDGLSKLVALRGATGEVAWEVKRPVPNSWSSPIVVEHGGKWLVITCVNPWLIAYSAADGSEIWRAKVLGGEVGPSPVFVRGIVYAANSASGLAAVRPDGTGDVTKTHVQWTTDTDVPDICSPLVTEKFVLLLAQGLLACFDATPAESGATESEVRDPLWEEDLLEEVSSSPSQVGNYVYLFSEAGKAWIVEPQSDACKRIAACDMGEPVRSSPAFLPGRIYVRGQEHLFCIGTQ